MTDKIRFQTLRVSHHVAEIAMSTAQTTLKIYRKKVPVVAVQLESDIEIETREGWLNAKQGDYLVANESNRVYPWPVKKEIFEATYEEWKDAKP